MLQLEHSNVFQELGYKKKEIAVDYNPVKLQGVCPVASSLAPGEAKP